MRPLSAVCVSGPGLAVVDIAACDDATAFAVLDLFAVHCAMAPADCGGHEPGKPGVRLRFFLNLNSGAGPDADITPADTGTAAPGGGRPR
ncbi:DUF6207 family protein [Streptomyces sp. CRN 30]|uniref:DUF6207 family protein n=1 Tax=Streptomyces sp. CRN 30 TaxID=3075613 RepID=UPI002A80D9D6|nr:DUF6207 family protein [Streptomyces sp. CRN 30]